MRKKIDTQRDQPHEEVDQGGRFGGNNGGDNFFLFSPPDFSLVNAFVGTLVFRMEN